MILFRLKCMPKITKMPYLAFWAGKCCNKFPVGLFCLIELCCSIVCGMEMCGCRENGTFPLIPQYHYKYNFLSTWATKSCSVFCHVRFFTYRRRRLFCLRHSYATSINSSWRGLTWRGSDSKQQAASRRLSSSSSLCQPNESGHQGSMCWISIHATTLMLICSRMTLDDTDNLWLWFCVLPQVAWWGKGHLYVFMVTFDALCPLLLTMQILFASVSY